MSVFASTWAWQQTRVNHSEKLVLMYLADKAGDNGISWHSRATIATQCLFKDPKSVQKSIANLERKGLVKRFKRFTKTGDQSSNYVVVLFTGRDTSDDSHFLDNDYLPPETIGGSDQPPLEKPETIGGAEQTPPGVCTDPTPGLSRPPKRNRNVSEKVSESVKTRARENFAADVLDRLDAVGLHERDTTTRIYAKMKIQEYRLRFPTSDSVADCWAYVVQAVKHHDNLVGVE